MLASLFVAGLALCGCEPPTANGATNAGGADDVLAISQEEFQPQKPPGEYAHLVLAGTPALEVRLDSVVDGETLTLRMRAEDETLDAEVYEFDKAGFRFVGTETATTPGTSFDPPIPLIKYPTEAGDEWTWTGKMIEGVTHPATAEIKASAESMNTPLGQFNALRVDVRLTLTETGGDPASRVLTFWIVEDHGVVQREFGESSRREPAAPPTEEAQ